LLGAPQGAGAVRAPAALEVLGRDLENARYLECARVVHEDVGRAELATDARESARDVRRIGPVRGYREGAPARARDLLGDGRKRVGGACDERDSELLACEPARQRRAQPRSDADHHRSFAFSHLRASVAFDARMQEGASLRSAYIRYKSRITCDFALREP
jgi:hypothetical protein